jgi:ribosome assembly protein RRB1
LQFPHALYLVAGSQADAAGNNTLSVVRLTQLSKMRQRDGESSDDESSSDEEDEVALPSFQSRQLAHHGVVNRVRSQPQAPHVVATWAETGHVQVWDIKSALQALNGEAGGLPGSAKLARTPPRQVFTGHGAEGFALDWSPVAAGRLLSGDVAGAVHMWEPAEGGRWAVSADAYAGHGGASVEDIQWSPNEAGVFATCGCDGTPRTPAAAARALTPRLAPQVPSASGMLGSAQRRRCAL